MKNHRATDPNHFSAPVPTGTKSGDPVLVLGGAIPAIASVDEGTGGNPAGRASVMTMGVFDLFTADAVTTEGTALYITGNGTTAGTITTTATGNTLFARTLAAADGTGATKASGGTATAGPFVHARLTKA